MFLFRYHAEYITVPKILVCESETLYRNHFNFSIFSDNFIDLECLSLGFIAMKRYHDKGNSYKGKHLIGVSL